MKQKEPFSIVHEDRHILAVNKAAGLAVGGDRWDEAKERLDRLVEAFLAGRNNEENERIYTVHRIDRDTSGIVVFAKDEEMLRRLSGAFEGREVYKRYIAVICGRPPYPVSHALVPAGVFKGRRKTIIPFYGDTIKVLECKGGDYPFFGSHKIFSSGTFSIYRRF
jgi:23S rRNA-/tRNA-specific pseudouridylate synthase